MRKIKLKLLCKGKTSACWNMQMKSGVPIAGKGHSECINCPRSGRFCRGAPGTVTLWKNSDIHRTEFSLVLCFKCMVFHFHVQSLLLGTVSASRGPSLQGGSGFCAALVSLRHHTALPLTETRHFHPQASGVFSWANCSNYCLKIILYTWLLLFILSVIFPCLPLWHNSQQNGPVW